MSAGQNAIPQAGETGEMFDDWRALEEAIGEVGGE